MTLKRFTVCALSCLSLVCSPHLSNLPVHATETNTSSHVEGTKDILWKYLTEAGYSEEASAGIMGNIDAESGYQTNRIQGDRTWEQFVKGAVGIGLAQWTDANRQDELFAYADNIEAPWYDVDVQIEYLLISMNEDTWFKPYYTTIEEFKETDDIEKATKAFMLGYEKPQDQGVMAIANRVDKAKEVYKEYASPKEEDQKEQVERKKIVLKEETQQEQAPVYEAPEVLTYAEKSRTGVEVTTDITEAMSKVSSYTNTFGQDSTIEGTITASNNATIPWLLALCLGFVILTCGYYGANTLGYIDYVEDKIELMYYRRKYGKRL